MGRKWSPMWRWCRNGKLGRNWDFRSEQADRQDHGTASAPLAQTSGGLVKPMGASPGSESDSPPAASCPPSPRSQLSSPAAPRGQLPGVRLPLSMEQAVRRRNLPVLRREAADALAGLGASHALVASARFTELQERRQGTGDGEAADGELATMTSRLPWLSKRPGGSFRCPRHGVGHACSLRVHPDADRSAAAPWRRAASRLTGGGLPASLAGSAVRQ